MKPNFLIMEFLTSNIPSLPELFKKFWRGRQCTIFLNRFLYKSFQLGLFLALSFIKVQIYYEINIIITSDD